MKVFAYILTSSYSDNNCPHEPLADIRTSFTDSKFFHDRYTISLCVCVCVCVGTVQYKLSMQASSSPPPSMAPQMTGACVRKFLTVMMPQCD